MREIKFRGKRIDKGEWAEGSLIVLPDKMLIAEPCGNNNILGEYTYKSHRVDPATVGQYTGLPDKNGRDIWEGDIVQTLSGKKLAIEWDEYNARWILVRDISLWYGELDSFNIKQLSLEVIGKYFDNPDLLGVE